MWIGLKEGDKITFVTNPKDRDIIYFKKYEKGVPLAVDFNDLTRTQTGNPTHAMILAFQPSPLFQGYSLLSYLKRK